MYKIVAETKLFLQTLAFADFVLQLNLKIIKTNKNFISSKVRGRFEQRARRTKVSAVSE